MDATAPIAETSVPERRHVRRGTVPDLVFASDNDFGIPTLLLGLQGTVEDTVFVPWGSISRRSINRHCWMFYVDDYKAGGVWANPQQVVNSECRSVVEVNYSTSASMPRALVLGDLYRKRWLSRYWQSHGVQIWVDLNVHPAHRDVALLGVPKGWTSYATRWHRGYPMPETLVREHAAAAAHAGTDQIELLVFGGGEAVRDVCASKGWRWVPEQADVKRGRFTDGQGRRKRAGQEAPREDSQPDLVGHDEPGSSRAVGQGQPGPGPDGEEVVGG